MAFERCDGLIGAAAPCDYRPQQVASLTKSPRPANLCCWSWSKPTDVVATLGHAKGNRWVVGFALETEDRRLRALAKLERKCCDLMVSNGTEAMHSLENDVEVLDPDSELIERIAGPKEDVARGILRIIEERLIRKT